MPRGVRHEWTREELEDVMLCSGREEHNKLAERLEVLPNTLYSVRGKVRSWGGIDAFLDRQAVAGAPLKARQPETVEEQMARIYVINSARSGRDGIPQYTVTIPSRIAERFIEANSSRQVRFSPTPDGILIVAVPPPPKPELPHWMAE
jgi:hypothetical protein